MMKQQTLKKETLRSCVVCKSKATKDKLHRFVKNPSGGLLLDRDLKLPGRGAYLHSKCVNEKSSYKLLYSLKENLKDVGVKAGAKNIDLKKLIGIKSDNKTVKKSNRIKAIFR